MSLITCILQAISYDSNLTTENDEKETIEARPGQDEVDILYATWHLPIGSL